MRLRLALVVVVACGKEPARDRPDAHAPASVVGADEPDAAPFVCLDAGPPLDPRLAKPTSRWSRITTAERDARERVFRDRNAGRWTAQLGADGFVSGGQSRDPCVVPPPPAVSNDAMIPITPEDLARFTAFVVANGDFFGVDDARSVTWRATRRGEAEAVQVIDGTVVGRIWMSQVIETVPRRATRVSFSGHLWPGLESPPAATVDAEMLRARYVGRTWSKTLLTPGMPCDPAPGHMPGPGCGRAPSSQTTHGIATKQDLTTATRLGFVVDPDALTLRRVVDVRPLDGMAQIEGLPATFDAVTGAQIKTCEGGPLFACALPFVR